jgi:hypothetical protein
MEVWWLEQLSGEVHKLWNPKSKCVVGVDVDVKEKMWVVI